MNIRKPLFSVAIALFATGPGSAQADAYSSQIVPAAPFQPSLLPQGANDLSYCYARCGEGLGACDPTLLLPYQVRNCERDWGQCFDNCVNYYCDAGQTSCR